ncbi:allantoin racemase [Devosia enhydra]|uniref:Allantoin racemase n=2 Tax=Devosia enhydra TaxID=665118 RepID=A0A1K2HY41_9HYPH|nr:allantoin racemase [Devosia enhydra]
MPVPVAAMTERTLLVINPNTNSGVTGRVRVSVEACAAPGTQVVVVNPERGPVAIETPEHRAMAVPNVLDLIARAPDHDGYVLACFDDIAIAEARALVPVPVISMAEAGIRAAAAAHDRFDVVTTVEAAVPTIAALVASYGMANRCTVRATGIGVSETAEAGPKAEAALARTISASRAAGAGAIVLGSGAYAGRRPALSRAFGLPFIDGLEAAIAYCEARTGALWQA